MRHPDYPIWSFISLLAVLLPAPWHWRARNVATVCLSSWLALYHLVLFINTLVWADNYADKSPIWCDISGRIPMLIPFAIPLCSLAQMHRLAAITSPRRSGLSSKSRKYRMIGELVVCLGIPLLMLPVLYTTQGHRYDIVESLGCSIPETLSWPSIVTRFVLPVVVSFLVMVYAVKAMRGFLLQRLKFRSILSSTGLTAGRYWRLFGLSLVDSILVAFHTSLNLATRIVLYGKIIDVNNLSWDSIHRYFNIISQYPEEAQDNMFALFQLSLPFYAVPIYALVFFVFFGFGEDAILEYVSGWRRIKAQFGKVKLSRRSTPSLSAPALGTTVVAFDGSTWVEDAQSPKTIGGLQSPLASDKAREASNQPGITVSVETSVV